ncbi:hypothetical protein QYE76_064769 [Lolium multiflorum]|uniref:Uncharacterized protein n=1 Tax=Lolium multiflorum TaxID=4521 RepID=A0AAD8S7H7_LOLMU|nr:hypothetical protein QYE76_064769 [Lolium multiflorum]
MCRAGAAQRPPSCAACSAGCPVELQCWSLGSLPSWNTALASLGVFGFVCGSRPPGFLFLLNIWSSQTHCNVVATLAVPVVLSSVSGPGVGQQPAPPLAQDHGVAGRRPTDDQPTTVGKARNMVHRCATSQERQASAVDSSRRRQPKNFLVLIISIIRSLSYNSIMPSSVKYAERMQNLGLHSHSDDKGIERHKVSTQDMSNSQKNSVLKDIISAIEKKTRQAKAWLLHQPRNKSTKSSSHANKDVGTPRKTKIHLE